MADNASAPGEAPPQQQQQPPHGQFVAPGESAAAAEKGEEHGERGKQLTRTAAAVTRGDDDVPSFVPAAAGPDAAALASRPAGGQEAVVRYVLEVETGEEGRNRPAQRAGFDFSRKRTVFRVGGDMKLKKIGRFFLLLLPLISHLSLSGSSFPKKNVNIPFSAAKKDEEDNKGGASLLAAAAKMEEDKEKPPSSPNGVAAAAAAPPPPPQKQQQQQQTTTTVPPPPLPHPPVPQWILGLISTTFFGPCPRHGPGGTAAAAAAASGTGGAGGGGGGKGGGGGGGNAETSSSASTKKADVTHWCCACLRPLCASCIQEREHPAGHRLQQVSRKE